MTTTDHEAPKAPKAQGPVALPLILAPIVSVLMCERAGMQTSVMKYRKAVTDPVDGREWSVRFDGGQSDIVCTKSPQSASQEQVFSQYERLRQFKATADHRAKGYAQAYERQKETDTPEMRESTRAEVERIQKEAADADARFAAFEKDHPECLKKRLLSEIAYWNGKAAVQAKKAALYEKAVEDWLKKADEYKGADDNIQESLAGCRATLAQATAELTAFESERDRLQEQADKIKDGRPDTETVTVPMGASVVIVP